MTSTGSSKNLINQLSTPLKNNLNKIVIGLGVSLVALFIGWKMYSRRLPTDIAQVFKLRQLIQKSYPNALQALETLKIENVILTNYHSGEQDKSQSSRLYGASEIYMQYLVMTRLKLKQMNKQQQLRNPFLPPFEDGLFVCELDPTHRLIYNKFNVFKKHLLVITKQFVSQQTDLTQTDFKQALVTMKALEGLIFFNCGKSSGASQAHKHIQIFPKDACNLPIVKALSQFVQNYRQKAQNKDRIGENKWIQFPVFNFLHGLIILEPEEKMNILRKSMYEAYQSLLTEFVKKHQITAYNLIATENFVFVVPRKKQKAFDQISVNSIGFMGSLLFKDQQKLNKYLSLKIKPSSILEDITFPHDYNYEREQIRDNQSDGRPVRQNNDTNNQNNKEVSSRKNSNFENLQ